MTTLAIEPHSIRSKISASAAIFFQRLSEPFSAKSFDEEPLVIQGSGDYEIGGTKISGSRVGELFTYRLTVDKIVILAAKTSSVIKSKESGTEYNILLLESDSIADQSVLTALNANVIIFYGEKKAENAKAMGYEGSAVAKFSVIKEKLPAETQVLILQ